MREFCRLPGKPCYATIYNWMDKDKEFATRIAYAREIGEEVIAQECIEIADDGTNDWETRTNKKGEEYQVPNVELVQRSKLRIETRLKLLAKWNPKKYGEKLDLNHSGEVGVQLINDIPRPNRK